MSLFESAEDRHHKNLEIERLYSQVTEEIRGNQISQGLWAKAFADCGGDEQKAKALYMSLRVQMLKSELEATREIAYKVHKQKQQILIRKNKKSKNIIDLENKRTQESISNHFKDGFIAILWSLPGIFGIILIFGIGIYAPGVLKTDEFSGIMAGVFLVAMFAYWFLYCIIQAAKSFKLFLKNK